MTMDATGWRGSPGVGRRERRTTSETGWPLEALPSPDPLIVAAIDALFAAQADLADDGAGADRLGSLPRPWDPASCGLELRGAVLRWLDAVAQWINTQHLWSLNTHGIPACWPQHPHLVHDLATVAFARYLASYAPMPDQIETWHRITLPGFLDRLRERLGDQCPPSRHQGPPRYERDAAYREARES